MSEFVHLHLHSQYSLLDGANRLDDVIAAAAAAGHAGAGADRPRQHVRRDRVLQHARKAPGSSRSSASRPTSRRAAGSTAQPGKGEQQPPGAAGPRTRPATSNLLKLTSALLPRGLLLQAAHRQGAAAPAQRGADRPLRLPQGRDQRADRRPAARRRPRPPRASSCEIFGDGNFYLEMQDHGIPEQRLANEVLRRISARSSASRWWSPTTATTCARTTPSPTTSCSASAPRRPSPTPTGCSYASRRLLPEVRRRDARALPRRPRRRSRTRCAIAERCNLTIPIGGVPPAGVPGAGGVHASSPTSRGRARGARGAPRRAAPAPRPGAGQARPRSSTGSGSSTRSRSSRRWASPATSWWSGTSSATPASTASRWARAAARRPARWSPTRCASPTSIRSQYDLLFERFLNPERISMPDIDIDFCMRAPRRGHRVRQREVRPRPGGPDHHLRDAGREGGDPRRRPRAWGCPTPRSTASPSWSPT